jgi:DUF1009 family protein
MRKDVIERLGVVAGRGEYPLLLCREAKRVGVSHMAAVAMHGETDPGIEAVADSVDWVYVGQLNKTIKAFKRQDVANVIFAGQIKPGSLFKGMRPDLRALKILKALRTRNAESIFGTIAEEFVRDGVEVMPATLYLENYLAAAGVMGKIKPARKYRADIEYGQFVAQETSRLDIGQTVIVKNGTVLAVEAFEGTDKAVRRGGEVGHGGVVVVKRAKRDHDMRFDVPCIGPWTVDALIAADAKVLAVEAGKTLFLERDRVLSALDAAKIAVVGFDGDTAPQSPIDVNGRRPRRQDSPT